MSDDSMVTLEKLHVTSFAILESVKADSALGATTKASFRISHRWLEHHINKMVMHLQAYVLAEKIAEVRDKVIYPRDWWEAFKDRWFPFWAKCRWPVRYSTVTVRLARYLSHPHMNYCIHESEGPIVFVTTDRQEEHGE